MPISGSTGPTVFPLTFLERVEDFPSKTDNVMDQKKRKTGRLRQKRKKRFPFFVFPLF